MSFPKKQNTNLIGESLLQSIVAEGLQRSKINMNVIEFAKEILGIKLWPTQKAILKAIYCLPFEKGLWRDILSPEPFTDENGTFWSNGLLECYGFTYDEEYDEREILDSWAAENKTTWIPGAKYSEMVLECGMRGSKCLSGDSYVFILGKGHIQLKDLLPTATKEEIITNLAGQSIQTRYGFAGLENGLSLPPETVYRVKGRYGYEIGGSHRHPVLVMDPITGYPVWKKLPEVKVGDFIAVNRSNGAFALVDTSANFKGHFLDVPSLARFCGYLVGNGYTNTDKSLKLTSADESLIEDFTNLATALFNKKVYRANRGNSGKADELFLFSVSVRKFLKNLGLEEATAYYKKVPHFVMAGTKETVKQFLRGLYDTDGFATCDKKICVGLTVASEELVKQVQLLLLQFGIISSRKLQKVDYVRQNGEQSFAWSLHIYGTNARQFFKQIGFGLERKQQIIKQAKRKNVKNSGITYSLLPRIKDIQANNIFWEKIEHTWETFEPTYDVVVPGLHEFVANGIVSHNTSLTSIPICYEFFRLLQEDDPAVKFGLMPGSLIALLVLATSEEQAQDTLFAAIKGRLENSAYFQGLIQQKKLVVNSLDIYSPDKNIKLWCGHSRCVSGDTLVATTEGMKRIDELVPQSERTQIFNVDFEVPTLEGTRQVTHGICIGKQPSIKLQTHWGYTLEGSYQHPVMVMSTDGKLTWKKMPELAVGDFVAIRKGWEGGNNLLISPEYPFGYKHHYPAGSSNTNNFDAPKAMTPELARFIGYLTGDGCVTIKDRIGFKSINSELVEDFKNICQNLFNTKLIKGTKQENNRSQMYWAYNKKLKSYLEWLGLASVKAPYKRVPWSIWQADKACTASYLQGLFDTDGYASSENNLVSFSNTSQELVREVQLLLLRLGIISQRIQSSKALEPQKYNKKIISNKRDIWSVVIHGSEVNKFMSLVGFKLTGKNQVIAQANSKIVCGINSTHAPSKLEHGDISQLELDRCIELIKATKNTEDLEYLKKLKEYQLFFDPVAELTPGEAVLYDFEVPEDQHFFSNGIVSHNSAGLVGRTLMMFGMDEANRFGLGADGSTMGTSGIDMYANVGKGTTTLRSFGAKKFIISSAWCEGDCTDVLYQQVQRQIEETGNSHILAFRLATWDINPKFTKLGENHPEIQQEYRTRGIEAKRDYAGIRPGTEESFFNRHLVQAQARYDLPIASRAYEREVKGQDGTNRKYSAIQIIKKETKQIIVPSPFFSYGHCDPGLKHDSFGLVAGHPEIDANTGQVIANISTVLEWRPVDKGRGLIYPVDYENVESQILELAKLITLKRLSFDHWNCYAVGSLISTPSGLRKVEELELDDPVAGKDSINRVVAKQLVAQKPVVTVKTKMGLEATVTPHHPFWVVGHGWKHARDLAVNDKIQIDSGKDVFGVEHDPLKALIYGYLVAERDWAEASGMVRFNNTETEVIHDFASTFEAVFNVKPTESKFGVRCEHDRIRHQIASEITTGAHNKHVPKFVLEGTEQTVGHFLAGLYEGDGNVRLNPKVLSVELNTVSKQLSEEVQLLLLRLGIKSSRKYFENKFFNGKQCPFYRITVYGTNIKTFLMKVGFRSNRKRTALNTAVDMLPETRRSRSADMHTSVVSVEATVADIVHLEVSGDHSYVGQGLVGHNSAMIIQRLYSAGISTSEFKSSFSQPVQREIYEITREWLTNGRIKLPRRSESSATEKLHKELEELILLKGRRIDHPKKGSKDLSDALACVVWAISQDERRYRYFETGSNKIRASGQINVASALPDLFEDGNAMAQRSKQGLNTPKNVSHKSDTLKRVRVTRNDWYGPGSPFDQR